VSRPPPLRTDGSNAFARYSMQVRVPRIVREVIERNRDYPAQAAEALEQLAREIEDDAPLPAPRGPAPDLEPWSAAHAEHAGESWLHSQWFHAELAVYREIAARCRFWETDRDPFAPAKTEELAGDRPWSRLATALESRGSRPERVATLLDECLWANRVDLSYAVAAGRGREKDDLLVDERRPATSRLTTAGSQVHVVADNTGAELALDLALVDALLEDRSARVSVHLKVQPVFVSDALARDVWQLLDGMEGDARPSLRSLAARLRSGLESKRLDLAPDLFWSGPRFLWEAPPHIRQALASATVVVLKGDANYRRLVGDAAWPPEEPFASAAAFVGTTVVCARTMKSDSVLGLPAGLSGELDATDERWRIDGRRGLIQTFVP
jgi:hypothetical protein